MGELLHRIGPVAVVVVVFTWCCWPYITGTATTIESQEPGVVPSLSKRLLSPLVNAAGDRDPFDVVKAKAALGMLQDGLAAVDAKGGPLDGGQPEGATPPQPSLVLTGTYIAGQQQMAIIDGNIYRPGQTLDADTPDGRWKVKEIVADHVLLELGDKTKVITYADIGSSRSASGRVAGDASRGPGQHATGDASSRLVETALPDGDLMPLASLADLLKIAEAAMNQIPENQRTQKTRRVASETEQ